MKGNKELLKGPSPKVNESAGTIFTKKSQTPDQGNRNEEKSQTRNEE